MAREIDKEHIAWIRANPVKPKLPKILSPKAGEAKSCLLLGGEKVGVWLHFVLGRTVPCTEPHAPCPHCKTPGVLRHKKEYLAGVTLRAFYPCLPELTPHALMVCPELEEPEQLRGKLLKLSRPGEQYNGAVWAALSSPRVDADSLIAPFDVPEALIAIWESEGRR